MLGQNVGELIGVSTERGEGRKHDYRQFVCAQAAMASSRNLYTQSSGEEQTLWSLIALVHNFSSATYQ